MPEELNARVEVLIDEIRRLRESISRRTRWVWLTIAAVVLVAGVALGGAFYLIDRNNVRQDAARLRQSTALCRSWKQQAEVDVLPSSTELGRSIVRTAADAYRLTGCQILTGDLGPVDPEAYRPAPR